MKLREELLEITRRLAELGLNRGTAGNVSVREGENFWITPSGMPVEHMGADDMVAMGLDGTVRSPGQPSSEWRFHRDILASRPEINAVVHTHSPFATTMACLRKEVPPLHYMMALAGGHNIRCADYALFGSQALSDAALAALEGRKACLLANHGMIALGESLTRALAIALEVETLCEQYWRTLQVGGPVLLSAQEMDAAIQQFKGYGSWNAQT